MWNTKRTPINDGRDLHVVIQDGDQTLSYRCVIALWRDDPTFRTHFAQILAQAPLPAFRWETPCVTSETIDQDFEFVLLRSDALQRPADSKAFASHFVEGEEVVTFPNLGRNAMMVVPCPSGDPSVHVHLASFVRGASASQVDSLWVTIAKAMRSRVGSKPVWLSTAGMGVAWLHVRLDDRPKYYGHAPYRKSV